MNNDRYLKIQNHSGYKKDTVSGAIVSDNTQEYELFLSRKKEKKMFADRLENVETTLGKILEILEEQNRQIN